MSGYFYPKPPVFIKLLAQLSSHRLTQGLVKMALRIYRARNAHYAILQQVEELFLRTVLLLRHDQRYVRQCLWSWLALEPARVSVLTMPSRLLRADRHHSDFMLYHGRQAAPECRRSGPCRSADRATGEKMPSRRQAMQEWSVTLSETVTP